VRRVGPGRCVAALRFFLASQASLLAIVLLLAKGDDDWRSPGQSESARSYICPECRRVAEDVPGPPPITCRRTTKSGRKHHPGHDVVMIPLNQQQL
jgi:hypothetical protein